MMPTHNTTTVHGGFHPWKSPIPYLFGGLAFVLGLIALALLLLSCSFRCSSSEPSGDVEEKPAKPDHVPQPEMEPKIVIMAGDLNPTYLAKPVLSTRHSTKQV
ncbi:unnamed protein product [Ilex paraguariensis]|uniref:Uncharacterized protein n=1 Tax=Ilex paraguariensis TaxID=185542 RepID=A0ABC8QW22_9AQUA